MLQIGMTKIVSLKKQIGLVNLYMLMLGDVVFQPFQVFTCTSLSGGKWYHVQY